MRFLAAGLLVCLAAGTAGADEPASDPGLTLTSPEWRPADDPAWYELHWQLLQLPERVVELAVTPLRPVFTYAERYRIPHRLYDLLSNDDGTAFLFPYVKISGTDGISGGVTFMHRDLFGEDEKLDLSGTVQTNQRGSVDFKVKAGYRQDVAWLNGRELGLKVSYEENSDVRFFGIGGDTPDDDREIRSDELLATLHGQLLPPGVLYFSSQLTLTYRREKMQPEEQNEVPLDDAKAPPGYGETIDLPEVRLLLQLDTRDSLGRTRSGLLTRFELTGMHDLNGANLSSIRGELDLSLFLEVLPRARVLVLNAGGAAAGPWDESHTIPYRGYVSLGRKTHLRGYKRDRFLDNYAWWASLEYRWPIFDIELGEAGISSLVFADIGHAGVDASGLFKKPPRWSTGFGFRLESATYSVARLLVGFSPEGVEITFSVGGSTGGLL